MTAQHELAEVAQAPSRTRGTVDSLYVYPVKGLSPQRLDRVEVRPGCGFPGDRQYALARRTGRYRPGAAEAFSKHEFFMLAKDERLAGLSTTLAGDARTLTVRVRGHVVLAADLETELGRRAVEDFFARVLGCDDPDRPVLARGDGRRFTDVSVRSDAMMNAVSVINLASVRALEHRLGASVDPLRFRANVYVDLGEPFAERDLIDSTLAIGPCRFRVVLATTRCAATEVDPGTARRDLPLPRLLVQHYGDDHMGVYAETITGGVLEPGQPVHVEL